MLGAHHFLRRMKRQRLAAAARWPLLQNTFSFYALSFGGACMPLASSEINVVANIISSLAKPDLSCARLLRMTLHEKRGMQTDKATVGFGFHRTRPVSYSLIMAPAVVYLNRRYATLGRALINFQYKK